MSDLCLQNKIQQIILGYKEHLNTYFALGDETRQRIYATLLEAGYPGVRVGEITEKVHLSRPAVSHHLKILKDADIVGIHKDGTKNYYYPILDLGKWEKSMNHSKNIDELVHYIAEKYNTK